MQISVLPCDWGEARPRDIEALLKDTASHLNRELRNPFNGVVNVKIAPPHDWTPLIHFRSAPDEPFVIQLTAKNRRWRPISPTSLHMNSVMFYLATSNLETTRIIGFTKQFASSPRYSAFGVWQSGGPLIHRSQIRQVTRSLWRSMWWNDFHAGVCSYPLISAFTTGCRPTRRCYAETRIKETRTRWWHTHFCQPSSAALRVGIPSPNSRVHRQE